MATFSAEEKEELAQMAVPLNALQLRAVGLMREELRADLETSCDFPEVVGDIRLLRFLRGHKYQLSTAVLMARNMLQWRKTAGVDAIREAIAGGLDPVDFPHRNKILRFYPTNPSHKLTREGRPLSIELTGRVRPRELQSQVPLPEFLQFHLHCMEHLQLQLEELSHKNGLQMRAVVVKDLRGLGRQHAWKPGIDMLREIISVTQDNYPECMHRCYLINAPWVFYGLWKLVKPLLAERTVNKVVILDDKYEEALKEEIAEDCLPVFLGGECRCLGGCIAYINEKGEVEEAKPRRHRRSSAARIAAVIGMTDDDEDREEDENGDGDEDEDAAALRALSHHPLERWLSSTVLWPLLFLLPYPVMELFFPASSLATVLFSRAAVHVCVTAATVGFLLRQLTPLSKPARTTAVLLAGTASAVMVAVVALWSAVATSYELSGSSAAAGEEHFETWDELASERVQRLLASCSGMFALLLVSVLLYGNEWCVWVR